MKKRFLILLIGAIIVLIAISGFTGSLITGSAQQANSGSTGSTSVEQPKTASVEGSNVQGPVNGIPAGHVTLGNAAGHMNRQ